MPRRGVLSQENFHDTALDQRVHKVLDHVRMVLGVGSFRRDHALRVRNGERRHVEQHVKIGLFQQCAVLHLGDRAANLARHERGHPGAFLLHREDGHVLIRSRPCLLSRTRVAMSVASPDARTAITASAPTTRQRPIC
jgi:hypothetical protein